MAHQTRHSKSKCSLHLKPIIAKSIQAKREKYGTLTTHSSSKVSLVSLTAQTFTCSVLEGNFLGATGKAKVSPKVGLSVLLSRCVQHVNVAAPAGKSCTLIHLQKRVLYKDLYSNYFTMYRYCCSHSVNKAISRGKSLVGEMEDYQFLQTVHWKSSQLVILSMSVSWHSLEETVALQLTKTCHKHHQTSCF